MQKAIVHDTPYKVACRLKQLGLAEGDLHQAVKAGELGGSSCTPNHPKIAKGLVTYFETMKMLRDILGPQGWQRCSRANLESVVSPDGVAVMVAGGNEWTGDLNGPLCTKHPKGPMTVEAINLNQMFFDFGEDFDQAEEPSLQPSMTWMLLTYRTRDVIQCELALPRKQGEDGRVVQWEERLPLAPIERNSSLILLPADVEPEVLVDVSRKAG